MHVNEENTPYVCQLSGRLDAFAVAKLKEQVGVSQSDLILDLYEVNFIDSSAIAWLIGLYKQSRVSGRSFTIRGLQDTVRLILEITGVYEILPIQR